MSTDDLPGTVTFSCYRPSDNLNINLNFTDDIAYDKFIEHVVAFSKALGYQDGTLKKYIDSEIL